MSTKKYPLSSTDVSTLGNQPADGLRGLVYLRNGNIRPWAKTAAFVAAIGFAVLAAESLPLEQRVVTGSNKPIVNIEKTRYKVAKYEIPRDASYEQIVRDIWNLTKGAEVGGSEARKYVVKRYPGLEKEGKYNGEYNGVEIIVLQPNPEGNISHENLAEWLNSGQTPSKKQGELIKPEKDPEDPYQRFHGAGTPGWHKY